MRKTTLKGESFVLIHELRTKFQTMVSCLHLFEPEAKQSIMEGELVREEAVHLAAPNQRKEREEVRGRKGQWEKKKRKKRKKEQILARYSIPENAPGDLLPPAEQSSMVFSLSFSLLTIMISLVYRSIHKIIVPGTDYSCSTHLSTHDHYQRIHHIQITTYYKSHFLSPES